MRSYNDEICIRTELKPCKIANIILHKSQLLKSKEKSIGIARIESCIQGFIKPLIWEELENNTQNSSMNKYKSI